ncbi:MAG TPA: tryptophan synthase subunit alpha [Candidatus Omnitrophota bacterium]|nr:tryptophan synthase subunit alpha [Candidatus Omnitrophota bacterium]HPN87725.1 tryptophan synthase subunit alpha [Candidatus Omnitrophota bacterium]
MAIKEIPACAGMTDRKMMNRIDEKFKELKAKKKKAFIAFITAGYPDLKTTKELVLSFARVGVDIIELGVPFSDPLADGPTIQTASYKALQKGITLEKILKLVAEIREISQIPIVLMSYYNPIFYYGEKRFVECAKKCGVDGVIIPDLPPEEAKNLIVTAKKNDFSTVFFLSPTTKKPRIKNIVNASSGFIYFVSVSGVTGVRNQFSSSIKGKIIAVKKITKKPICIGFGISTPQQVKTMSQISDGVIVGSAIVSEILKHEGRKDLVRKVSFFVSQLTSELS